MNLFSIRKLKWKAATPSIHDAEVLGGVYTVRKNCGSSLWEWYYHDSKTHQTTPRYGNAPCKTLNHGKRLACLDWQKRLTVHLVPTKKTPR